MEKRNHDKIRPFIVASIFRNRVVLLFLDIEAELFVKLRIFLCFCLFLFFHRQLALLFHFLFPHRPVSCIFGQLTDIHFNRRIAIHKRHERSKLFNDLALLSGSHPTFKQEVSHPKDEILFLHTGEYGFVLEISIRILLLFSDWNLLDSNAESQSHSSFTRLHHSLDARPKPLIVFRRVGIRDETQMRSSFPQCIELSFRPSRAKRSDSIQDANDMKPYAVRRPLHEIELFRPQSFSPCRVDPEHRVSLVVYETFIAVHILRRFPVFVFELVEKPGSKSNDMPLTISDGDGDTSTEEVVATLVLQVQLLGNLLIDADLIHKMSIQRAVSDTYLLTVFLSPSFVGVVQSLLVSQQLLMIFLTYFIIGNPHRLLQFVLIHFLGSWNPFLDGDAVLLAQFFDSLFESEPLMLHQERNGIPIFPAPKALESPFVTEDSERRSFLLMERAARLIISSTFL